MPCCFAPGCFSGTQAAARKNKELGKRNPSLFLAPKDIELLEKWRKAVPRKDRLLKSSDRLCELHFTEDCIDKTFTTKLFDGSISVIEREKALLKKGSVPTLFPNPSAYFSFKKKKRKPPTARVQVTKNQKTEVILTSVNENSFHDADQVEEFSYTHLINQLESVQKPNPWWIVSSCPGYIICSKLNHLYQNEWNVAVSKDLIAKIFLGNDVVSSLCTVVDSIESLSSLLFKIDRLVICKGVEFGKSDTCSKYITVDPSEKCLQKFCTNCTTIHRKRLRFGEGGEVKSYARKRK